MKEATKYKIECALSSVWTDLEMILDGRCEADDRHNTTSTQATVEYIADLLEITLKDMGETE